VTSALPFTPAPEFYVFIAMLVALPAFIILAVAIWWTDKDRRWPRRRKQAGRVPDKQPDPTDGQRQARTP
jgi:hypothetical protein